MLASIRNLLTCGGDLNGKKYLLAHRRKLDHEDKTEPFPCKRNNQELTIVQKIAARIPTVEKSFQNEQKYDFTAAFPRRLV